MKILPTIQTRSGLMLNFVDPRPEQIVIGDIAHALARINRFNGHTSRPISVAEHSVNVSFWCPEHFAFWGLMHDAAEAYVGDMSMPLKQIIPIFRDIEKAVMEVIVSKWRNHLGPDECPPEVKEVDLRMLASEARDLMGDPEWAKQWRAYPDIRFSPGFAEAPEMVERIFLDRFLELTS